MPEYENLSLAPDNLPLSLGEGWGEVVKRSKAKDLLDGTVIQSKAKDLFIETGIFKQISRLLDMTGQKKQMSHCIRHDS